MKKILAQGFTLIELLIVIAIIGTLAVVLLVAINPVEQLAKTRDTGRISAVTQLGRAQEAYAVNRGSAYTAQDNTWITSLNTAGEVSTTTISAGNYSGTVTACSGGGVQNGFCYKATTPGTGGGPIIVYARLEAKINNSKCGADQNAFVVYSSFDGRSGVVCTAAGVEPAAGAQTFAP